MAELVIAGELADHPRVCGENFARALGVQDDYGSPPRVRGKRAALGEALEQGRITPACAGKTHLYGFPAD